MAGDWIKIRTDLVTSPKVVRMASALKADRFRIAGGLLSVWSLFDAHSADGQLEGYTPELIDELAAWPGFSDAMIDVGWLEKSDSGLSVPRFDAHNGASAKRRAMDADRKREVRKMSASDADEKRTREEKRREEKKEEQKICASGKPERVKSINLDQLIAIGVNEQHAKDWLAIRKAKRAPLTETALDGVKREADLAGITLAQAIKEAAERGWQGFKAEWLKGAKPANQQNSRHHGFDGRDYTQSGETVYEL